LVIVLRGAAFPAAATLVTVALVIVLPGKQAHGEIFKCLCRNQ
jgi:hypothetical protein